MLRAQSLRPAGRFRRTTACARHALAAGIAGIAGIAAVSVVAGAIGAGNPATASGECSISQYAMGLRYQQSANAEAAQRQAWLLATKRLSDILERRRDHRSGGDDQRPAVVSDLDETVLDNTALLARDLEACHDYTTWDTWSDWEIDGNPLLTPGARHFFRRADRAGVAIYYISDRYSENIESTMATLRELGLPQVRRSHVLLYGLSKEERRASVAETHDIVLLLGDSLPDFDGAYDGATPEQQHTLVDEDAKHWGRDWIMFPNAAYGGWRRAELRTWDAPLATP